MTFKLDKRLNLVIAVDQGDRIVHIHSQPVSRQVFERYHRVFARTFSNIINLGLGTVGGPRTAALEMAQVARELGQWEGEDGVERGLFPEIRRLTNMIAPGSEGWTIIPFQEVCDKGLLSEDDAAEVWNAIIFFITYSAMMKRATLIETLDGAASMWGAQISSLTPMEYATFLKTPKGDANIGARPIAGADALQRNGASVAPGANPLPIAY